MTIQSADGVLLEATLTQAGGDLARGTVLLVHGITVDLDEGGGMFIRLAHQLAACGFEVMRFSFRGHGRSGGTSRGVTVAGECLDLEAAVQATRKRCAGPLSIVAASFGAVPTLLALPWLEREVTRLVLWNPVLDLVGTFLEPELAWGRENFGPDQLRELAEKGCLTVDGNFELGRTLFAEIRVHQPLKALLAAKIPTLIVHGDRDNAVSYDVSAAAAAARPATELHTVRGSDHGFDSRARENEAIVVTARWLVGQSDVAL
ncbi:alpha/beta hydrolase [Nocardia camponoti]|uniref:Alpha/beta hydrolase n=1 Tax=Nocardia camponoti TaxID=1616106 RepID=A0A917QCL8_9NOCA|nr:alpha/beta fold hydrolase [Nocardia camponoti]GGK43628.1 alpha/beta hydrolase [Nocardia camponoti]